ncbi:MAG: hypothetical protein A3F67_04530 [Verrucomicrobia bacterium RIFCSPHIGHO2_12_FULL_41_10]|nr:MAG: hypothetical protein A3F67_04530 [Verrucomicrobia bacterium RIFCSPHIGHO2_12_FULL_41_10]
MFLLEQINHRFFLKVSLVAFFMSLAFFTPLEAADPNDPADQFLLAYQNFQQGERLERAKSYNEAVAKYRFAQSILTDLSSSNPSWQKPVVEYRLSKIQEHLERLNVNSSPNALDTDLPQEKESSKELSTMPLPRESTSSGGNEKTLDIPSISITPPAAVSGEQNSGNSSQTSLLSDKEVAQLHRQLKKMEFELQKARGDLNDKTTELDHSKVTLVDMKSQLEKAERRVADFKNDLSKNHSGNSQREAFLQKSLKELEGRVDSLTADKEVIEEDNNQLQRNLKQAADSLVAGLGNKKRLEELQLEVSGEKNALATLHEKLIAAQKEHEAASELNIKLQKQLKEANASLGFAEKQTQEVEALRTQIAKLQIENSQKNNLLAETKEKAEKAESSEKSLIDSLQTKLASTEAHQGMLEQEKSALEVKLQQSALQVAESEKKILALEKAQPEKDQLLQNKEKELLEARHESEKLQKELLVANQKLSTLQEEVHLKDDRYNELKKQLDQKNEEIAALQKNQTKAGEKVIAENELLKGIVLRELKEEAKRQQIKKLITEDLQKLKINSSTLSLQLQKLAKPMKLSPEERALFKDTPLSILAQPNPDPDVNQEKDGKLMLSASVAKKEDSETHAENKEPLSSPSPEASPANVSTNLPANEKSSSESEKNKEKGVDVQEKTRELMAKAKEQFEHQNYLEAEKSFQDILVVSPDDYLTLSNLGVVEFQLGKMSEAEKLLKKACMNDRKKSFALTTLGIVHYRQERMEEAEKVLRQAIAVSDQDFTAHNYLGIVLAASGKSKAGESEIMKALEFNPQYADAHFNLAVIYATGKPPAKQMAKSHYTKALSLGAPPDASLEKMME